MSPVSLVIAKDMLREDLSGTTFTSVAAGTVIFGCKLANTRWPAKLSKVHIHDCTGVAPKMIMTCCWFCGRFTDEQQYAEAVAWAYNALNPSATTLVTP